MSLSLYILLPLFLRALGASDALIGLSLGTGATASVLTRPLVGRLLDRAGRRPVLLAAGALNVVSWLPFAAVERMGPWVVAWMVVHSVAWGALFAAFFTLAADLSPPARRAEGLAVFGLFGIAANGLAPVLGEAIVARRGFPAFFLTAAAFGAVSAALTALVRGGAAPGVHAGAGGLLTAARAPGLLRVLAATLLLGVAINAAWYFVAPFTRDLGLERAGPFFAAYAATSVVIRFVGRRSLDGLGPHRVSTPAFLAFAAGLTGLVLLPAPGVLVLCGVACGVGHGTLFPVLSALAVSRAPAGRQGAVVSLHTAALDLGAVLGTPLCGLAAQAVGWRAMFAATSASCLVGLALIASDPRRPRTGEGM
jgi:MFS family permease